MPWIGYWMGSWGNLTYHGTRLTTLQQDWYQYTIIAMGAFGICALTGIYLMTSPRKELSNTLFNIGLIGLVLAFILGVAPYCF